MRISGWYRLGVGPGGRRSIQGQVRVGVQVGSGDCGFGQRELMKPLLIT
jgi:hypothetical protein